MTIIKDNALSRNKQLNIMQPKEIEQLIKQAIECDYVHIHSDDLRHYAAIIVSSVFSGLSKIKRHQQVYSALGSTMGNEIHAMSIQAMTPEEYQKLQS